MDRPTFSSSWSRVSRLTPKLRPEVQITRQLFRGHPWHVVHDPVSNNFFRLNPVAYYMVGLFDGRRSVDELWRLTLERYGDAAPTQGEVVGLLSQLNTSNLLRVDMPPDAEPLLQRQRQRKIRHWGGQAMSILFMRMPIFNPDKMLNWLTPLFRPILSKWGLIAWAAWIIFVTWQFAPHLRDFLRSADSVLAPTNWGWMVVLFIVTKILHELGHGLVCKRFGGVVPQVGIMLLVLFPVPYVDATSSWNFGDKWKRMLVGGAGMLFELVVAGAGALVWVRSEPDTLARQLSYNLVFLSSVSTILFNANPLLRFDGYYMLSDWLEIPNLYERAKRHMNFLVQRHAYGMTNAHPVSTRPAEQSLLLVYGIAALIYRVLVLFGIILFVSGKLLTVGIMLATWSIIAWALVPLGKFIHWLTTNRALHEHRTRAITVTICFTIVLFTLIGAIPMPEHRRAVGVVECSRRADLAMHTPGFVTEVNVESGQPVRAGQVILTAENPELSNRYQILLAQRKQLLVAKRQALAGKPIDLKKTRSQLIAINDEIEEIEEQLEELVLRSPIDGTLVGPMMAQFQGQFLGRGQVVGRVVDLQSMRVTALVDQAQNAALYDPDNGVGRVELRAAGHLSEALPSQLLHLIPAGQAELPHTSLGYAGGGGIAVDTKDPQGLRATQPQFELWLDLREPQRVLGDTQAFFPGQRVYVRMTLENPRPLLAQWIHRLRQVIRQRVSI